MPWWLTAIESLAVGALGGMATVYGLSKWLGDWWLERQKAKYNKELEEFRDGLQKEQKKLQAAIDRQMFVTRSQFDTEFGAMKDVFKGISEVMLAMNGVRPIVSTSPPGESREDKKRRLFERLGVLTNAYDQVVGTFASLSLFYPEDIYAAVQECLQAANTEILTVQTSNENEVFKTEWFQEGELNRRSFMIAYRKLKVLMRKRIETLSELPSA